MRPIICRCCGELMLGRSEPLNPNVCLECAEGWESEDGLETLPKVRELEEWGEPGLDNLGVEVQEWRHCV